MAAVSLARASLELVPASFSYELVCHVAACVWVSMFAIWNLVFVQLFVYLFIHANTESALLGGSPTRMTMSRVPERAAAGGTAPPGSPQFVRRRTQVPPLAVSV